MISVQKALQLVLNEAKSFWNENVLLENALGKILAEDIKADRNYPPFNRATMDGYAFLSTDVTEKGISEFSVAGELFAGYQFDKKVNTGECIKIMTGSAAPAGLDCIVQVELSTEIGNKIKFSGEIKPWKNIAREGEDCKKDNIILKEGIKLSPVEIGALAALGKKTIRVKSSPKVAILSTGDELVPVGEEVTPYQIRDSNAYALQAFFQSSGIQVTRREIVSDSPDSLKKVLGEIVDFDIVVLSGGVSMGAADYVPAALLSVGIEKVFHKIKLKPGKPLWFGKGSSGGVFFGLPGNPLSCQVCFKLFIEPYVRKCFGLDNQNLQSYPVLQERVKKVQLDEYFPVKLDNSQLEILQFNGSGDVTSALGSTGIALHPIGKGDVMIGDELIYVPWQFL